jgi:glutamate racemase
MITKIGIMDSGVGGTLVSSDLIKRSNNHFVIFLDFKNIPYGKGKTKEQLFYILNENLNILFNKYKCDIVILACNTISSVFLEFKEKVESVFGKNKIIDIITLTKNYVGKEKVNLIATTYTVNSGIYDDISCYKIAKDDWVIMIEDIIENGKNVFEFNLEKNISFNNDKSILLGCTHFSLLEDVFKKAGYKIVSQKNIMNKLQFNENKNNKKILFLSSSNDKIYHNKIEKLCNFLKIDKNDFEIYCFYY